MWAKRRDALRVLPCSGAVNTCPACGSATRSEIRSGYVRCENYRRDVGGPAGPAVCGTRYHLSTAGAQAAECVCHRPLGSCLACGGQDCEPPGPGSAGRICVACRTALLPPQGWAAARALVATADSRALRDALAGAPVMSGRELAVWFNSRVRPSFLAGRRLGEVVGAEFEQAVRRSGIAAHLWPVRRSRRAGQAQTEGWLVVLGDAGRDKGRGKDSDALFVPAEGPGLFFAWCRCSSDGNQVTVRGGDAAGALVDIDTLLWALHPASVAAAVQLPPQAAATFRQVRERAEVDAGLAP